MTKDGKMAYIIDGGFEEIQKLDIEEGKIESAVQIGGRIECECEWIRAGVCIGWREGRGIDFE